MPAAGTLADALSGGRPKSKPVKLSRANNPDLYDSLVRARNLSPGDLTGRNAFSDFLQENGTPGAHVVAAGDSAADAYSRPLGPKRAASALVALDDAAASFDARENSPGNAVDWRREQEHTPVAQLRTAAPGSGAKGVTVTVHHVSPVAGTSHTAHARTQEELDHLLSDFPEAARAKLLTSINTFSLGLENHLKRAKKPRPKKLSRTHGAPYNKVFASSSQREGSTVHHARAGFHSPEFAALSELANQLPGVKGGHNGVGFWSDGAEESRIVDLNDPAAVKYVMARLGKAHNQKAVIGFTEGPGKDIAHVLHVPNSDPERVADGLNRAGIEYKTIAPDDADSRKSVVHIIDNGGTTTPQVERYVRQTGAHHERHVGTVHYLERPDYDSVLTEESHRAHE